MSFQLTYSQQDSITKKIIVHNEALTVGKYYSFYLKIGDPLFGKVMSLEENKLIVYSDKNMEEIDTANITNILDPGSYLYGMHSESTKEGYNKFYLFMGAGYARTRAGASYSDDYSNGINITINALVTYTSILVSELILISIILKNRIILTHIIIQVSLKHLSIPEEP